MRRSRTAYPTINAVLGLERLATHFQPIVSVSRRRAIGMEALTRGVDGGCRELLPPRVLFQQAAMEGLTLELDRACRRCALERFVSLHRADPALYCCVNIASEIIVPGVVGSSHLVRAVEELGIDHRNVVIEINEARNGDVYALQEFIARYQDYGFHVALDNVGLGITDLGRLPLLRPNFVKLDRMLLHDIDQDADQQVVVATLVTLASHIDAQVVATGIEREAEALTAVSLGVDLLQGFYFAEPLEDTGPDDAAAPLRQIADAVQARTIQGVRNQRARHHEYGTLLRAVVQALAAVRRERFDAVLAECVARFPIIAALYVLNGTGVQVTDTVLPRLDAVPPHPLARPTRPGDDHGAQEHFYLLVNTNLDTYTTPARPSPATGTPCHTLSTLFRDADGYGFVLCAEFPAA
jgi:EAL domain-containing protein (putative c-di-GMP-specific phosphodiesterase class I)